MLKFPVFFFEAVSQILNHAFHSFLSLRSKCFAMSCIFTINVHFHNILSAVDRTSYPLQVFFAIITITTIVSPTVFWRACRVDSPIYSMSVRLRLELRAMTIIIIYKTVDSRTWCAESESVDLIRIKKTNVNRLF